MKYKFTFLVIICSFFAAAPLFSQNLTYTVSNSGISRTVKVDSTVTTVLIQNLYTGKSYKVHSEEFKVMVDDYNADFSGKELTNKDFRISGDIIYENSRLVVPLFNKEYSLRVNVNYSADGSFYSHKWLEFQTENSPRNVSVVEVERMYLDGVKPYRPMPEQDGNSPNDGPVFAGNLFLGLEFPKQDNSFDGEYIRLRHFPGRTINAGETLLSKKSVLGASPNKPLQRLKDSFFQYLAEYRKTQVRNFKVYNTWFLLVFDQTEEKLLNAIESHVKPLFDRGITLDGFVVDDGWQDKNTLWEVNKAMIPDGLAPDSKIQKALKKYDASLHLWMPLTGLYGLSERRKEEEWYKSHGYETGSNWSLCLAPGNKIFAEKKERILELVRQGVTSFKADFAFLGCDKKGHNHLPNKYYGMEANVEGVIDIIKSARKINSDLFYYLTTAINKSPWWLETNDILWESRGADIKTYSGNGEPNDAIKRMSGRDEWHFKNNMHWFVPQTSYMTHGIIGGDSDFNGLYASLQDFINNAVLYYARGVMWSEIYVTTMNDEYWNALADVIKWSDRHWNIFIQQPALSGGPSGKKPYYWSHFKDGSGVIILRNPTAYKRGIEIPLDESSRVVEIPGQNYKAEVVKVTDYSTVKPRVLGSYKFGESITAVLNPWEVVAVEVTPAEKQVSFPRLNVADIDFGTVATGTVLDSTINVSSSDLEVSLLNPEDTPWLSLRQNSKNNYTVSLNTTGLENSSIFQADLKVESASEPYQREVVVFFKTGADPNAKEMYLSDLEFESHDQSWGNLGIDKTVGGKELSIAGRKFSKGLGTHSTAQTIYKTEQLRVKRFQAFVGQDDETSGTISFKVFVDNGSGYSEAIFESGVMRKGDAAKFVDADISKAKYLKLVVDNGGDNINGDHADWADAKLIR